MDFRADEKFAREMDAQDSLAPYREKFYIPKLKTGESSIYFAGNSLGLQPKSVRSMIEVELKDWELFGVEGHVHSKNPWVKYHEFLTEQLAVLVGAKPIEVVVMNTLTVNLHLLMVSFYRPTKNRHKILIEQNAFPSDQYAVKSQINFHKFDPESSLLELEPRKGNLFIQKNDLEKILEIEGNSIALIMLGGVNYYTGQVFDMQSIVELGHKFDCIVGFDLAHATGNVPLNLHDWNVDFAVWCSYKYLNGGPGCIGGAFVHEKHTQNSDLPRFEGWWGHDKTTRFQMPSIFKPIKSVEAWQISNPPILPLASLKASLDIFNEVGMDKLRAKSVLLTDYLEYLIKKDLNELITIITPSSHEDRGCQLSLVIKNKAQMVFNEISKRGVICDWREPDVIRCAPVPLYNSFSDVYKFVNILKEVLQNLLEK